MGLLFSDKSIKIDAPNKIEKTVYEKRATTDESIRILREMEQKIYENIIHNLQVEDNNIKYRMLIIEGPLHKTLSIKLTINGRQFDTSFPISHNLVECIRKQISLWLTDIVLVSFFDFDIIAACNSDIKFFTNEDRENKSTFAK